MNEWDVGFSPGTSAGEPKFLIVVKVWALAVTNQTSPNAMAQGKKLSARLLNDAGIFLPSLVL